MGYYSFFPTPGCPQVFSELDQEVQDAAAKYLSERHVYDLGPYIFQYIDEKEQKLYMEWLQGTIKFLET
jgi:hypothetical protein